MARRGKGRKPDRGSFTGGSVSAGGVTFEVDDAAFQRGLRVAVQRMQLRTEADLQRVAIQVQNEARKLCPVDTGRLRASIQHEMGRDGRGTYARVGTNVEYAPYVEFGTRHAAAQPYMRPALMQAAAWWVARARAR